MLICLDKQHEGPLGIHVLPYCDDEEQCEGLIIKEIVKSGRIDRDGRFSVGDRIIEVNDQTLLNVNFETAQSLIGEALKQDEQLKLNIVKNSRKKQMNYTLPNSQSNHHINHHINHQINHQINHHLNNDLNNDLNNHFNNHLNNGLTNRQNGNQIKFLQSIPNSNVNNSGERLIDRNDREQMNDELNDLNRTNEESNYLNEVSPDDYTDAFKRNGEFNASNTRRVGKKYHIRLIKDLNGLGFSITTRDNQVGKCPIYIKTILPVGAAKKDGNLKGGDRLLEVNGIEMTGKTHDEALKVLRDIETGQKVDLIVSRQENNFERTSNQSSFDQQTPNELNAKLPRQIPVDKLDSNQLDLSKTREVLSFNVPLNDTGSAGLGVSVKGKTSTSSSSKKTTDLGIFVKNIFRGGAAYKDGRLKPNDQLISINGISLLNSNNEEAMNTLRSVIKDNGGVNISSNSINLVVARVTDPMENPNNSLLSTNSMAYVKEELYDTFGARDMFHQRNMSTISSDSIKLNFYEQNYQPSDQTDFMNQPQTKLTSDDFNELYNLNRKSHLYNDPTSKESLTDSNEQFTISTPVKTSMKSDFTDNELNLSKFHRTDVLIENDQENNDPNRMNDYFIGGQEQLDESLDKDSQMMNLSNVTNQLSLNDDDEIGFNFQRDGIGRQSMSEKRYAQLDAKNTNTDTFKRAKQRKLQSENGGAKEKLTPNSDQTHVKSLKNCGDESKKSSTRFPANCCCFNEPQTYSQSSRSSCPHHSSQHTSPQTDKTVSSIQDDFYSFNSTAVKTPLEQSTFHFNQQPTPFTLAYLNQQANQLASNQPNFLNRPINQMNSQINKQLNNQMNNHLNNQMNYLNNQQSNYGLNGYNKGHSTTQFGSLGMKKSSSLESLQTMMHEIKKENINYNTNQPFSTMRRPTKVSRNRNTNESFRNAIDKSYEEHIDNLAMETVNEEFSESGFPTAAMSGNQTMTKQLNENVTNKPSSTSLGTTLSNGANEISDDEVGLIRRRSTGSSKKKMVGSGILRTLFRFGSKKFKEKDKQTKLSTPQHIKKELEEEVEKIRARKAALYEQEVIQEYYKRLIDQQKFQQIVNQQTQQRQLSPPPAQTSANLKKQSIQSYKKPEHQNIKNLYVMENTPNYIHQSNSQQPMIMNKQNYETHNYMQTGNGLQNRPIGLNTVERPKSSYLTGFENNILVNQNGYTGCPSYYELNRKPFTNSHLSAKQHPAYLKDKSIHQFETLHSRTHNYDLKDAMQRPGSRVAIDLNEDLNHYVITVARKNNEVNRPYA